MTLAEFRALHEEDRYIEWLTRSVQVLDKDTVEYYYALYQLDGFYIEMKFSKWSDEEAVMRTFCREQCLQPYLYNININGIFAR